MSVNDKNNHDDKDNLPDDGAGRLPVDDDPTELGANHPAASGAVDNVDITQRDTSDSNNTLANFDIVETPPPQSVSGPVINKDRTQPRSATSHPAPSASTDSTIQATAHTSIDDDPTQLRGQAFDSDPTELKHISSDNDPTQLNVTAAISDDDPTQLGASSRAEQPTQLGTDSINDAPTLINAINSHEDITQPNAVVHEDETVRTTMPWDENATQHSNSLSQGQSASRSEGSEFRVLQNPLSTADGKLGEGTVLKGRFRLEGVLGEGGMGVVYKAVDLLKLEARDRNPYVAIKVLTENFKQQGGTFIALQREASKAQRLAHPNIATVYDFDRDGSTVFMTMELLEGEPLNEFIKRLQGKPLPKDEAMEIILGLAQGLGYAHEKGLVHSDFKPGNAFVNKATGLIKVLDFGIARAAKHQVSREVDSTQRQPSSIGGSQSTSTQVRSGDKTMFDPSTLGALTPAYATIEMFEGEESDPRDDIYALACVSYELLTGQHPYNRLSAPKAQAQGLRPLPVAVLTRRQQQTLIKSLSFDRADRTPDIDSFIDGITPRPSQLPLFVAGGALLCVLLGAAAYPALQNHYQTREMEQLLALIEGNSVNNRHVLDVLNRLDATSLTYISGAARKGLIEIYRQVADELVDEAHEKYNFIQAEEHLDRALKLFGDSSTLKETKARITRRKHDLLDELRTNFEAALSNHMLVTVDAEQDDIPDILYKLKQIDPKHPLLTDSRLGIAYAQQAERAIAQQNYAMADNLLTIGQQNAPEYERLRDLHDSVRIELQNQRFTQLLSDVEPQLQPLLQSKQLAEFEPHISSLEELASYNISNSFTDQLFSALTIAFEASMEKTVEKLDWSNAETQLQRFFGALPVHTLLRWRLKLIRLEQASGFVPDTSPDKLADAKREIEQILTKEVTQQNWGPDLINHFKRYTASQHSGEELTRQRSHITVKLKSVIDQAIAGKRFLEARRLLGVQRAINPVTADIDQQLQTIELAQQSYEAELRERERTALIEAHKLRLLDQARANTLREARETYKQLQELLDSDDPFLKTTAPQAIAAAYLSLALEASRVGNFTNAQGLALAGLEYHPDNAELLAVKRRSRYKLSLNQLALDISDPHPDQLNELHRRLISLRAELDDTYPKFQGELIAEVSRKLTALEQTKLRQAHRSLELARALFPDNKTLQQLSLRPLPKPSQYASVGLQHLQDRKLNAARQALDRALQTEPKHADTQLLKRELEQATKQANVYYDDYRRALASFNFDSAAPALEKALAIWQDNGEYHKQQKRLNALQRQIEAGAKPCEERYASYGSVTRATCFDVVGRAKQHGPTLVVVPAREGQLSPYAISKYEISVADFNLFCSNTPHCSPDRNTVASLPVTGVTPALAKQYVAWLSERSGQAYRLPSKSEWQHAARANGQAANTDSNCTLHIGNQQIKGLSLLPVDSGKPNPWGLHNYTGNAVELATEGSGFVLLGGSYRDALSNCTTNNQSPLRKENQAYVGLRVIRSINF